MAILLNDNYSLQAIKPFDARYLNISTPWASVGAANAGIPTYRYTGLTVNILGSEYWYKDGVADINLVKKESSIVTEGITGATNGLTKVGQIVILGGALTGNTSLTGAYDLSFSHTNINLTGIVGITGAINISGAIDGNSTLDILGGTELRSTLDVTGATIIGGAVTLSSVAAGATSNPIMVLDSGVVKCVAASSFDVTAVNGLTAIGNEVKLGGTLTGSTLIETGGNCFCFNDNSSCNFIEMNSSVPNVRLGQKDLSGCLNSFSVGATGLEAYTECAACFNGFRYANCFADDVGNMLPNSIPDVKWVTGQTSTAGVQTVNNGLTKVGTNAVLGGALTGDTTISGAQTLLLSGLTAFNACATNIGLTGIVGVTGAVNISGAIDAESTLNILDAASLHSTLDVTGATTISGVVTLTSVAVGSVSTDEVMLITSGGVVKKVAASTFGEENNIYNITIVTGATIGTTASTYVQLISGATTFTLPASPQDGQAFKIKDACGDALASPITIDAGSGLTIDGSQCALINTDYGALELVYGITNKWFSLAFVN